MKKMRKLSLFIILLGLLEPVSLRAQHVEPIAFGDFEHWVTREIKESALLGGKTKTVYAIAPTQYIKGNKAYRNMGGSPWASSNVMANVMGIVKTSNTVRPEKRQDGGTCACMETVIEDCRVLGMMNLHVLVSGSIFLGEVNEPIRSTSNPYGKMEMGIPFTKRPVRFSIINIRLRPMISVRNRPDSVLGNSWPEEIARKYIFCCSTGGKMRTEMCMLVVWALGENDI